MSKRGRTGDGSLTGGTKDTNPHYRTVLVKATQPKLTFNVPIGTSSINASLIDNLVIDTGIAQNVPGGRKGDQIVMELLYIDIDAAETPNSGAGGAVVFMDSTFDQIALNGGHWAKEIINHSIIASTSQLPNSDQFGKPQFASSSTVFPVASTASFVDFTQPTAFLSETERLTNSYGYPQLAAGTETNPASTLQNHQAQFDRHIDFTDDAGHGILIPTQHIYLYNRTNYTAMWELQANAFGPVDFVTTYDWLLHLTYRWKKVSEQEYLQLLIQNTIKD